jgi:7-cyano-7-deazaguanine reductase
MSSGFYRNTPLGVPSRVARGYTPALLCPLPRAATRQELALSAQRLPFSGVDIWNLYEVSWLNPQGKPQVAVGQLEVPCDSTFLVESKSLKLYLNAFNQSRFASRREVARTIEADLTALLDAPVALKLWSLSAAGINAPSVMAGECLDDLEVTADRYLPDAGLLRLAAGQVVEQQLYSDLFRSCCPVTGQPDWASVSVAYRGQAIDKTGLLQYLISYRDHNGFHEQCVERIFVDIQARCQPQELTVYARFLRRGGIDINPFRTNAHVHPDHGRLIRQ